MTLSSPAVWSNSPRQIALSAETIHLWRLRLDDPMAMARCAPLLTQEEAARAGRFVQAADCWGYTICRGTLRALLGELLDQSPASIELTTGEFGKPRLADGAASSQLPVTFNVAHSRDWGLIGVSLGVEVGVDIEQRRTLRDLDQMAKRILAPDEWQTYCVQSPAGRARLFQRAWCAKEAIVKSLGQGLSYGVEQIFLTLDPSSPLELLTAGPAAPAAAQWTLYQCEPVPDYLAAVAAPRPGLIVYHWDWPA